MLSVVIAAAGTTATSAATPAAMAIRLDLISLSPRRQYSAAAACVRQRPTVHSVPARLKLPVAVIAALVVAEGAVWLLRPGRDIEPVHAQESSYFSHQQLARANVYASARPQVALLGLVCEGGALVLIVARPPQAAFTLAERT